MKKLNVAVIGGGDSSEAEVSLRSVATVFDHFDKEKYNAYKVTMIGLDWYVEAAGTTIAINKDDFSFELEGEKIKFDYAFIVIHGTPGEDGKLQGYLDMQGVPYNTCDQSVSALTFDKWYTILAMKSLGFPCAKSLLVRKYEDSLNEKVEAELAFPVFVKPCDGGSSYGVSKVSSSSGLKSAVEEALNHGTKVLIEAEMKGIEVTCGIYKNNNGVQLLEITEVVSENDFFDYDAKYKGKAEEITPARLKPEVAAQVKTYTKEIYEVLGMKGMARIDFIIIEDQPHVLEINTTPGMTEASFIPQQVRYVGMTLKQFFNEIVENTK